MATKTFTDVQLGDMLEELSQKSGGMFQLAFALTPLPSTDWLGHFQREWERHLYNTKPRVDLRGTHLTVSTPRDQLEENLTEIRKVIAETNAWCRQKVNAITQQQEDVARQRAADKAEIAALKKEMGL